MINPSDLEMWTTYVKQAKLVLVILPNDASFDQQLAAASLSLSLEKSEKKSSLHGVTQIANSSISGLEGLTTKLGSNHLLVSFDYSASAVDKVSYHLDDKNNKFYLTIKPQKGEKPLEKDSVQLEYVGADADLIVVFGIQELNELEQLYIGYEDLYQSSNILHIGSLAPNFQCAHSDLSKVSSSCEVVYRILVESGMQIDSEIATNLLAGIQYETDNFINFKADAETFEAISGLLKAGARRKKGGFNKPISSEEVAPKNIQENLDTVKPLTNKEESSNTQIFSGKKDAGDSTVQRPSGLRK